MLTLTPAERLLYSTVMLTASKNGAHIGTGTGFLMEFARYGDDYTPAIVTNKHVIEGADAIMATFHLADGDRPSGKFVKCRIEIAIGSHFEHPEFDLCAIPIAEFVNMAKNDGVSVFFGSAVHSLIPNDSDWEYFDAIEEVIMIGYPRGISDELNNLPIVRRGITASPLSRRYNGKDEFIVDMACFPGSSGSPVFIYNSNGYIDRRTNSYALGGVRFYLVGILYAGPQVNNQGEIILGNAPMVTVRAMMHLGYVIRSSALHTIDAQICRYIGINPASTPVD